MRSTPSGSLSVIPLSQLIRYGLLTLRGGGV